MITINGKEKNGYDGRNLVDVLTAEGYDIRQIAVEINGDIISRTTFEGRTVNEADTMEVVSFVGGG